jgi:hypothetical protein
MSELNTQSIPQFPYMHEVSPILASNAVAAIELDCEAEQSLVFELCFEAGIFTEDRVKEDEFFRHATTPEMMSWVESQCRTFLMAPDKVVYLSDGWIEADAANPLVPAVVIGERAENSLLVKPADSASNIMVPANTVLTACGKSVGMIIRRNGYSVKVLESGVLVSTYNGEPKYFSAAAYQCNRKPQNWIGEVLKLEKDDSVIQLVDGVLSGMVGW